MSRTTSAGTATVRLLCRTVGLSRQAYYGGQRAKATTPKVVTLPTRPGRASAEVVLAAIRVVIAREPAWGVRKVWVTRRRAGLHVSRKRVWALMHAHGLVLAAERAPVGPHPGATSSCRSRTGAGQQISRRCGPAARAGWRSR